MQFSTEDSASSECLQTDKPVENQGKHRLIKWLFPFTGLFALIWFLIRVIPKPSRATYPCQRVAFPLASGFIIWLIGLAGSVAAFHRAKHHFLRARYVVAAICIMFSVGFVWTAISTTIEKWALAENVRPAQPANAPIGVAKGIHPGRVSWVHDANATDWTYVVMGPEHWWEPEHTNQAVVNRMMSESLRALTGEKTDTTAWDAIFRYFNQQRGKENVGYTPGEKIAIKVNFTTMYNADPADMEKPSNPWWADLNWIDNSPQLTIALLDQLVKVVGVNPCDISIGDPSRIMSNYWYNMVHGHPGLENVVYLTRDGYTGSGRTIVAYDQNAPFYWSDPCSAHFSGVTQQDYIPKHFAQADYFINFPVLKTHEESGITLCGKNHYGSLIRNPSAWEYIPNDTQWYNMHWSWISTAESPGMKHYRAMVDLMGHPKLGGKTLLYLIDGLFAAEWSNAVPSKWQTSPFNNDWPSSIFVSQDGVAADSVGFDFLLAEWPKNGEGDITVGANSDGSDDYLHEAALANDPCSGTFYDPNNSGTRLASLGVHEHWNNSTAKQYTRNLDPENGKGIELATELPILGDFEPDSDVDLRDFAVLANAWQTHKGDAKWNSACDISMPSDNTIDWRDLKVFADNWRAFPP